MYSVTGFPRTVDRTCHPLPFRTLLCMLIILVLALAAPVSAAVYTINPGDSIQTAISSAGTGDTIILNPGTYNEWDIVVNKNVIIRANTTAGGGPADTIIDAGMAGRIFTINSAENPRIDSLTLKNGQNSYGGAIYVGSSTVTITSTSFSNCSATYGGGAIYTDSWGTVNVTSSSFSNCSSPSHGGAIYTDSSTVNVTSSSFSNCSSIGSYGGAIYAYSGSYVTITSSSFSNCSAVIGGAIQDYDSTLTISSSTFSNCSAPNDGSAIATSSGSTVTIHFSRIYNNTGTAVYGGGGFGHTIDAADNWWGTNSNPSVFTTGSVTVSPWLVLNITATPSSITTAQTSTIRTNLTRNSAGFDTTSGGIFVPAGIPVAFAITSGTGSVLPQAGNITSGANTTTFTSAGSGTSTVSATVDGETIYTDITVAGSSGTATMVGVYRPSIAKFILKNDTERTVIPWGLGTDLPVAADWNGDGLGDIGVYRPSIAKFILKNGTERTVIAWGLGTDTPVAGDWNGDGLGDVGVYRPSIAKFILKNGTERTVVPWGLGTDIPVAGDWNGDSLGDVGVYRPSIAKFILKNGTERTVVPWGLGTDTPVAGDWNGDSLGDVGVYRPSIAKFILKNGTERTVITWGLSTDIPVTGKWS